MGRGMRIPFAPAATLAWTAAAASGCIDAALPGEPVAAFDVVGTLDENGCGARAVPVHDPLRFSVELRRDGNTAYWRRDGERPAAGRVIGTRRYRFTMDSRVTATEATSQVQPGCTLAQTERVEASLTLHGQDGSVPAPADAGTGPSDPERSDAGVSGRHALTGSNRIELAPTAASHCGDLRAERGGPFLRLPCRIGFTLHGTERPAL